MRLAAASALMPLARLLDPETAHRLSLRALALGLAGQDRSIDDPVLAVLAFNRRLPNPIGLAAGFDKDAIAINPLARLGFGFIEAGTVTLRPQTGNPRPRLFRLAADRAVINRMGFNNNGIEAFVPHLQQADRVIALGANLGINKDGAVPERDYPALINKLGTSADYVTINVSSPNTQGLRDLQSEERLARILDEIAGCCPQHPPVFVKIAPDLSADGLAAVVETCLARGVTGLVISNTTIARPDTLRSPYKSEAGGLSGAPLFAASTAMLARAYRLSQGRLMLIGAGGIFTAADAFAKIRAGATLVQLYTAFAYHGPALIPHLKADLATLLKTNGYATVAEAIGTAA